MAEMNVPRNDGETYAPDSSQGFAAGDWRRLLEYEEGPLAPALRENYGGDPDVLAARRRLYLSALSCFIAAYGPERRVYLMASPSRINWEGHHVDHQGGNYNSTTHANEVVAVCSPRDDDQIDAANILYQRFPRVRFLLSDEEPIAAPASRWANYIKGGFLSTGKRLGGSLRGADLVMGGDIPVGAGLSSSHALVLCSVLSCLAANSGELSKNAAVACVQEGEWFTGSRTGLGDQATMIFGKRDRLFFGRVLVAEDITPRYAPLPPDVLRIMINSYAEHSLHGKERLGYNSRVFAYRVAYPLLMAALEECGATGEELKTVNCLADISPRHFPTELIYRALRAIPAVLPMDEVHRRVEARPFGTDLDTLIRTYFGDDELPEAVRVRGIALYGLAECHRSVLFGPLIREGRIREAGELATVGHNGDRLFARDASGEYQPVRGGGLDDADLDRLIDDRLSGDPDRVARAGLEHQPGEYRASVRELDELVDIALDAGAISASLTGGGLGGVVTSMIDRSRMPELRKRVMEYYAREEQAEIDWIMRSAEFADCFSRAEVSEIRKGIESAAARKQTVYAAGRDWEPSSQEKAVFEGIRNRLAEMEEAADEPSTRKLQYLPADYHQRGIQENVSTAGAGYLVPPTS